MNRRAFAAAITALPFAARGQEPKIRVGQIGTQHSHAAGKMEAIRSLEQLYDVVGLAEDEGATGSAYDGLPRVSMEDLLALPEVQLVLVEGRLEQNAGLALQAIQKGKHVHLDKPGALDHAEFAALHREAERRRLTIQMGYMLRYNPAFELLFTAVKERWFGEITEIDAMMGKLASDPARQELGQLAGGGMFELACHIIDAALHVMGGKPNVVHAFSTPTRADGVQDNQLAVLEYPQATVTIRCNHSDPFGGPRRLFQITGTKGGMEIRPLESGKLTLHLTEARGGYRKGSQSIQLEVPRSRYAAEFIDMAQVIRGHKRLGWDADHDIAVHETVLRAAGIWP
jgi:predicted dehydrogenase